MLDVFKLPEPSEAFTSEYLENLKNKYFFVTKRVMIAIVSSNFNYTIFVLHMICKCKCLYF